MFIVTLNLSPVTNIYLQLIVCPFCVKEPWLFCIYCSPLVVYRQAVTILDIVFGCCKAGSHLIIWISRDICPRTLTLAIGHRIAIHTPGRKLYLKLEHFYVSIIFLSIIIYLCNLNQELVVFVYWR